MQSSLARPSFGEPDAIHCQHARTVARLVQQFPSLPPLRYEVEYCLASDCTASTSIQTNMDTTATITSLTPATDYEVRIQAWSSHPATPSGVWSSYLPFHTKHIPNVMAAPIQVDLWTTNTTETVDIRILWVRPNDHGSPVSRVVLLIDAAEKTVCASSSQCATMLDTVFTDVDVGPSQTHVYSLRAYNEYGWAESWSDTLSISTPPPRVPATPAGGPTIESTARMSVVLTWVVPTDLPSIKTYRLRRTGGAEQTATLFTISSFGSAPRPPSAASLQLTRQIPRFPNSLDPR